MKFSKYNPGGRKTDCSAVEIGNLTLFFSYDNLIGINANGVLRRVKNQWSPTTEKHFDDCDLRDAKIVEPDVLKQLAEEALWDQVK